MATKITRFTQFLGYNFFKNASFFANAKKMFLSYESSSNDLN